MVRFLTDNAPLSRITDLLDHLPMDDAAEAVSEASPQIAGSLLADLEAAPRLTPPKCAPCWHTPTTPPDV